MATEYVPGVEYRTSLDGQRWEQWLPLQRRLVFSLLYLPQYFEFRSAAPGPGDTAGGVAVRPEPVASSGLVSQAPDTS